MTSTTRAKIVATAVIAAFVAAIPVGMWFSHGSEASLETGRVIKLGGAGRAGRQDPVFTVLAADGREYFVTIPANAALRCKVGDEIDLIRHRHKINPGLGGCRPSEADPPQ